MSVVRARHARNRSSAGARVQLFVAGGASSEGPSAAGGAGNDRGGSEGYVVTVRRDVRATGRPSIPPEKLLRGAVIAGALAEREPATPLHENCLASRVAAVSFRAHAGLPFRPRATTMLVTLMDSALAGRSAVKHGASRRRLSRSMTP
jgi:hypothetical protein